MTIQQYIKDKDSKHYSISGIQVYKTNNLTNPEISDKLVISNMISKLPSKFLRNIKSIYIGDFKFLKDREMQAAYHNSTIYVTNVQRDSNDMLDDLIHEVAHSVEELYGDAIYSDGQIEKEFLQKREKLKSTLESMNITPPKPNSYQDSKYSLEFDSFLYNTVGYEKLSTVTSGVFYSPYGATSLNEYFANGFEAVFFDEDLVRLRSLSPILYNRIKEITNNVKD